jgi:hypothetical protein
MAAGARGTKPTRPAAPTTDERRSGRSIAWVTRSRNAQPSHATRKVGFAEVLATADKRLVGTERSGSQSAMDPQRAHGLLELTTAVQRLLPFSAARRTHADRHQAATGACDRGTLKRQQYEVQQP